MSKLGARKLAAKAVPGVGQAIMLVEGTPAAKETVSRTWGKMKETMAIGRAASKRKGLRGKAAGVYETLASGLGAQWELGKGALEVAETAITNPTAWPSVKGSPTRKHVFPVRLGYGDLVIFSRMHGGQGDPLYALLSRRGLSVDWVTVMASAEELDRLEDVAGVAAEHGTPEERHTAELVLPQIAIARAHGQVGGQVAEANRGKGSRRSRRNTVRRLEETERPKGWFGPLPWVSSYDESKHFGDVGKAWDFDAQRMTEDFAVQDVTKAERRKKEILKPLHEAIDRSFRQIADDVRTSRTKKNPAASLDRDWWTKQVADGKSRPWLHGYLSVILNRDPRRVTSDELASWVHRNQALMQMSTGAEQVEWEAGRQAAIAEYQGARRNPAREVHGPQVYEFDFEPKASRAVGARFRLLVSPDGHAMLQKIKNLDDYGDPRFAAFLPNQVVVRSSEDALQRSIALATEASGIYRRAEQGGFVERTGRFSSETAQAASELYAEAELLEKLGFLLAQKEPILGFYSRSGGLALPVKQVARRNQDVSFEALQPGMFIWAGDSWAKVLDVSPQGVLTTHGTLARSRSYRRAPWSKANRSAVTSRVAKRNTRRQVRRYGAMSDVYSQYAVGNPSPADLPVYQGILAHLRALHWLYFTSHWQVEGPNFYGDHLLLERLYGKAVTKQIDGLGERMVMHFGSKAVDPVVINARVQALLTSIQSTDPWGLMMTLESSLQVMIRRAWKANQAEGEDSSLGLDNFLMQLADERDMARYLLGQRMAAVGVAKGNPRQAASWVGYRYRIGPASHMPFELYRGFTTKVEAAAWAEKDNESVFPGRIVTVRLKPNSRPRPIAVGETVKTFAVEDWPHVDINWPALNPGRRARRNSTKSTYPFAAKEEQYRAYTVEQLRWALKDATEARDTMKGHDPLAEAWYADDVHTILTKLRRRGVR